MKHDKKDVVVNSNGTEKNNRQQFKKYLPYLVLSILISLNIISWQIFTNHSMEKEERRFKEKVDATLQDITDRLKEYQMILQGGGGLFFAAKDVSREVWRAYIDYRQVGTFFPGIQGMGFSTIIRPDELESHIKSIRAEGFPDYTVWPEGQRDEYTAIMYHESFDTRNLRVLGYDMFTESLRRTAMIRARDTGTVSLSRIVPLVQELGQAIKPGFLLFAPVYSSNAIPESLNERRETIRGFVYAQLRMDDLMNGIFPKANHMINFKIYNNSDISPFNLMYDSQVSPTQDENHSPMFSVARTLDLHGHQWTLVFTSMPLFEAEVDRNTYMLIPGGGFIISLLIFLILGVMQNTSKRAESIARQMTMALRQSEEKLRLINDNMDDVVWLQSRDNSEILYLSPSYEKISGRTCKSLHDKPETFIEIIHPQDLFAVQDKYRKFMNGERIEHEFRILRPDGKVIWLNVRGFAIKDNNGNVENLCGLATDITERKNSEEQLRRTSELLNISGRIAKIGGWELDLVGTQKLSWTEETYHIHEVDPGTKLDLATGINFYAPESQSVISAAAQAAIENGESFDLELQVITARNKTIWVRVLGIAERRDGRTERLLGSIQDITERKQAESELQVSEERFRKAMKYSPVGMAIVSPAGHWLEVNDALCQMVGYSEEELLQYDFQSITHADDRNADLDYVGQLLAGEISSYQMEKQYLHKDGRSIWVIFSATLIRKTDGSPDYFISQILDLSEQKQAEQDRIARQAAEEANRQKSLFLSNMSHEIRTPMNAILGFSQILERDPSLSSGQMEQVRSIRRSGDHLLNLINDILDISRIESGRIELRPVVFSLGHLMDDLALMFRSRAEAKNLQLIVERNTTMPSYVRGDEAKLRQILINLLGNAVKFTDTGGISLRVRTSLAEGLLENDRRNLQVEFEVEDSGFGIPEAEQDKIFETFHQAEAGAKAGGTGLGLAISLKLVQMMGGTLSVESVEGKGSCFRFDVLLEPAEGKPEPEKPRAPRVVGLESGTGPWRILVVDGIADNHLLLRHMLRPLGFELREAVNGAEALEIFTEWTPHAVLMDMRMPVMDGYEATRRIKATHAGHTTPVIAVTASAFKDSVEGIMATGVSAYLRKPFQPDELYEILGKELGLRYIREEQPAVDKHFVKPPPLTAKALSTLPLELVQEMRTTVSEGDITQLSELISRVDALDSTLAMQLASLARKYDYSTLADLLKSGDDNE